jgi:hypothetical protein
MAETTLSPEAVEALATSLAVKLSVDRKTVGDLANQMSEFHQSDKVFKAEDKVFKESVSTSLSGLRRQRVMMPVIAIGAAFISIVMSVIGLAGTAQAVSKLSEQINAQQLELREQHLEILRLSPDFRK